MTKIILPQAPPSRPKHNANRADPFELLGVANTGASKRGNTFWKTIRTCPREHALRNVVGWRRRGDAEALTVGVTFHHALEVYYRAIQAHQRPLTIRPGRPTEHYFWGNLAEAEQAAWASIEPLRGAAGYEETYAELERMLGGYFDAYRRKDHWRIIAVEETLEYEDDGLAYSARLDLVVEDYDRGGMWVVEHKSARTITEELVAGYQLDQQILGQVWLLRACVDAGSYPTLRGVLVNIATKHKRGPRLERVECMPSRQHLVGFEGSLRAWHAVAPLLERLGWPQALGNCAGPARYWSKCDYYDICYGQPDVPVEALRQEPPPMGFVSAELEAADG